VSSSFVSKSHNPEAAILIGSVLRSTACHRGGFKWFAWCHFSSLPVFRKRLLTATGERCR
jgi:hypothetical protein